MIETLNNCRANIANNTNVLKREWRIVRENWKDHKAKEYERTYLVPIIQKEKIATKELDSLCILAKKLRNLGVDV